MTEAVSARASRASRFAPWKNTASAQAFRSRRRLPYVRKTAGIGSAAGHVRPSRDESVAPSLLTLRQHFSAVTALKVAARGDRSACGGESRGRRGSSDPADLERRVSGCRKTSRSGPLRRRRSFRHHPSSGPTVQPMPAVARIVLAAAGAVSTPRGGTFCRVANGGPRRASLARWGEKREAGADEPRRSCAP